MVDEDFSWKDPKAAEHFGKSITDYVIGGMDRDFKLKTASSALRGRAGRPVARHHQCLPRRLSPIDRKRPQGGQRPLLSWRQFPRRLWPRAGGRRRQHQRRDARRAARLQRNAVEWVDKHGQSSGSDGRITVSILRIWDRSTVRNMSVAVVQGVPGKLPRSRAARLVARAAGSVAKPVRTANAVH